MKLQVDGLDAYARPPICANEMERAMKNYWWFLIVVFSVLTSFSTVAKGQKATGIGITIPEIPMEGTIVDKSDDEKLSAILEPKYLPRACCNLLVGIAGSSAMWRDNHVPILRAYANVDDALNKMSSTPIDHEAWRAVVSEIYQSNVSANDLNAALRKKCEKFPWLF